MKSPAYILTTKQGGKVGQPTRAEETESGRRRYRIPALLAINPKRQRLVENESVFFLVCRGLRYMGAIARYWSIRA